MKQITRILCTSVLSLAPVLAFAQAQDAQEIIQKFEEQQKTRGLVLLPSNGATAPETQAATQVASADYQALDRDQQINLQISFDFDSAALRADQKPVLDVMCQAMNSVDVAVFQIIGHTDAAGSSDYNQSLSLLRAQEVRRHLIESCGISADRLQAIGMGESALFDPADPRSDENRRVEFQALG